MPYSISRRRMVDEQLVARGIKDPRVLAVMRELPRHLFVAEALRSQAYGDAPLPIGHKQTISQPYMVAFMTEALGLQGDERVLEVGTGSGYQAAVLARLVRRVYSVERIPDLARSARRVLDELHLINVNIKVTDGSYGWEEQAPFDAIMVTAGAPSVPENYVRQLTVGGRLVIPVGGRDGQTLKRMTRVTEERVTEEVLLPCRFVPLVGGQGWES